jgi:tetratricopeptide (TPR) repeat protein
MIEDPDRELGDHPAQALRISYDADLDFLWALLPGEVIDGQMDDETDEVLSGVHLWRRGPVGPFIGFGIDELSEWDVMANDHELLWDDDLRFDAPTLGLVNASIGEIALAAQTTIHGSTFDVMLFDAAIAENDPEVAVGLWRATLEVGEMKAHFGLGHTLVELGRPNEAFGHLRYYTEIAPRNSWAWLWRGRAAEGMGELDEAATCYRTAIEAEHDGGHQTDAADRLAELEHPG